MKDGVGGGRERVKSSLGAGKVKGQREVMKVMKSASHTNGTSLARSGLKGVREMRVNKVELTNTTMAGKKGGGERSLLSILERIRRR